MELFRREALDGQDRLHGEVVFIPQVSWRMLFGFLLAALAVAAFYLFAAYYRPATPVAGRLAVSDGLLVASFEISPAAAEATVPGQSLRLAVPGTSRILDARVSALRPSGRGTTIVRATLDRAGAAGLGAGMTVNTALPARSRTLAAALYDQLTGRGRE